MKTSPASKFLEGRRGPFLALCVPLLCSCVMALVGSRPQAVANLPELPGLAFDQYLVDLREVAATDEVFAYFGFRNTSPNPITITSLVPSCGCLSPRIKKNIYRPGENGEFLLRVKTALQQPGFKEFTVQVNYTDSKPRTREVYLRAVFPEKQIYVRPMSLSFHQLGTSPVSQEFVVTDLRENPADVIAVTSSSDLVELQVLDPVTTKTDAREQRIRVTVPGAIPSGRHEAIITIYTNDGKFKELQAPIQLFGPERFRVTQRQMGPQPVGPVRR